MKKIYFLTFCLLITTLSFADDKETVSRELPPLVCGSGTTTMLYSQDFETGFPTDWSHSTSVNPQWTYTTGTTSSGGTGPSGAFNGTGYVYFETSAGAVGATDTLFAPSVNLTSTVDAARVSWAYHMFGATMGSLEFQISTDGVNWTQEWFQSGQVQTSEAAAWNEVEIDLTPHAGSIVQMRFIVTRGTSFTGDAAIDLFQVEACISCPQPSGLIASNETTTTVDLNWTAGGTETAWIIEYGPAGFTPGTGTQFPTTNNPETLTGLIDNTNYDIYVMADCGGGDTSIPDGPVSAITLIVCTAPTNFMFTYTSNDTVAVTWTPGGLESNWNIEWGPTGYTPGTGNQHSNMFVPDTTTGLVIGGIYDFYVQADCGSGLNNPWAGPLTYVAPIANDEACNAINVPVNGSTNTFANVGASESTGETTAGFNTAWFTFTAPPSGHVEIKTCGGDFNSMLGVYSVANCSNYGAFVFQDGATGNPFTSCAGTFDPAGLNMCGLSPGNTYYLVIGGELVTDEGIFPLTLTEIPTVEAGVGVPQDVCEDNAAFDLFTAISGNDTETGQWYNPTIAAGNEFASTISFTTTPPGNYPFYYVESNVCDSDNILTTVTVHAIPNTGQGGIINQICNHESVSLYDGLSGTITLGGEWHYLGADIGGSLVTFNGDPAGIYSYWYVIDNGGCPADSSLVNVNLKDCVGLEDQELISAIYPNPVKDLLSVNIPQFDSETVVKLMNMSGQLVIASIPVTTAQTMVDMTSLARGVYFLHVANADRSETIRIIKE